MESGKLSRRIPGTATHRADASQDGCGGASSVAALGAVDSRSRAAGQRLAQSGNNSISQNQSARKSDKRNSGLGGGGETPRPPLEQSGSRPDGGGGRHRPAASTLS